MITGSLRSTRPTPPGCARCCTVHCRAIARRVGGTRILTCRLRVVFDKKYPRHVCSVGQSKKLPGSTRRSACLPLCGVANPTPPRPRWPPLTAR